MEARERVPIQTRGLPAPSLDEASLEELDNVLPRFIDEVKRKDGGQYPPSTLYQLMCALQRYLRTRRAADFQKKCFMDVTSCDKSFLKTAQALECAHGRTIFGHQRCASEVLDFDHANGRDIDVAERSVRC